MNKIKKNKSRRKLGNKKYLSNTFMFLVVKKEETWNIEHRTQSKKRETGNEDVTKQALRFSNLELKINKMLTSCVVKLTKLHEFHLTKIKLKTNGQFACDWLSILES